MKTTPFADPATPAPRTPGRTRRALLRAGLLLLFASGLGAAYQYVATQTDTRRFPPPGRLVDVGGFRLHIQCSGSDGPTVILEAGMGLSSLEWIRVQPQIARFARVCAYDRAGYGWSDPSPAPRTAQVMAHELHRLLVNAGVPGPYILVAHSFGAFTARRYARDYADEVAGMVLVDPSQEDQYLRVPAVLRPSRLALVRNHLSFRLKPILSWLGVTRLRDHGDYREYPAPVRAEARALELRTAAQTTLSREALNFDRSAAQVRAAPALGDLPLVVITEGQAPSWLSPAQARAWQDYLMSMHAELARLSTNGSHQVAERSGHMIPLEQPELITAAVERLAVLARLREEASRQYTQRMATHALVSCAEGGDEPES